MIAQSLTITQPARAVDTTAVEFEASGAGLENNLVCRRQSARHRMVLYVAHRQRSMHSQHRIQRDSSSSSATTSFRSV